MVVHVEPCALSDVKHAARRINPGGQCPLGIKSVDLTAGRSLPVYLDNRTSSMSAASSQECVDRTIRLGIRRDPTSACERAWSDGWEFRRARGRALRRG